LRRFLAVLFVVFAFGAAADEYRSPLIVQTVSGDRHLMVEVADSARERSRGLMFRPMLEDAHGMLFDFGKPQRVSFWMKNTLIPLDLIFIDESGEITHIHPQARPHDETAIPSKGEILAVLEINGGLARQLEIQVGDTVRHEVFGNLD
jgi:hypothetical protein